MTRRILTTNSSHTSPRHGPVFRQIEQPKIKVNAYGSMEFRCHLERDRILELPRYQKSSSLPNSRKLLRRFCHCHPLAPNHPRQPCVPNHATWSLPHHHQPNPDPPLLGPENQVPPLLESLTQHLSPQHSSNICSLSRTKKPHDKYLIGF